CQNMLNWLIIAKSVALVPVLIVYMTKESIILYAKNAIPRISNSLTQMERKFVKIVELRI
ncbi:unnamed protein product, partial [marine sediment metagenome]